MDRSNHQIIRQSTINTMVYSRTYS